MRKALLVIAVLTAVAVAAAAGRPPSRRDAPPEIAVVINGRSVQLTEGTTLRRAAALLRLRPRAGDVLDVGGRVLRRGAFRGKILLNGEAAAPTRRLQPGDRIRVVNGHDRREPLTREVVNVRGGLTAKPQFILARTAGSQIVVRGAISHKLVSVRFRPRGPERVEPAVALTFDDGPSPRYSPRILAVLRRLHVPATFFAIGYLADEYPDLIRAELLAGMTVENHSYSHPQVPPFGQLPRRLLDYQIALGVRSLRRLGADAILFRPPGGSFSPALVRVAHSRGERTVLWSVDPGDWQHGATPRGIARKVLAAVRPGSIVLLHDGGGDRSATAAALPRIIKAIRRRGLELVALPSPTARPIDRAHSCARARTPDGRKRAVCR
jgi:peptidoglycan/xylan/chitin deacetylase (PgdA/CDA1 family)/sulfur carrier protein ThiS